MRDLGWKSAALFLGGMAVVAAACGASSRSATDAPPAQGVHPTVTTPAASANDPSQLLAIAEQDATGQGWAHAVVRMNSGGHQAVYDQYDGPGEGRQDATIDGHNHLDVIVLNNTAYFQADAGAASIYMQLPATTVNQIAQKWVEVPSSDQAYSDVAQDVDIASVLTDTTPSGPLSVTAPTTMDGRKVVGIMGSLPAGATGTGSSTLYISTGSNPVPVAFTSSGTDTPNRVDFSKWGATQTIAAPPRPISASSVGL